MRIVFATTRGAGHLGPLIPIARACMRAGHDVLVAGHPEVAPRWFIAATHDGGDGSFAAFVGSGAASTSAAGAHGGAAGGGGSGAG